MHDVHSGWCPSYLSIALHCIAFLSIVFALQSEHEVESLSQKIETRRSVLRSWIPQQQHQDISEIIELGWTIERRLVLTESQTRVGGPLITAEERWIEWVETTADVCSDDTASTPHTIYQEMDGIMEIVSGRYSYTEESNNTAATQFLLPDNRQRHSKAGGVISGSLWSSAVAASILFQSPRMRATLHGDLIELGSGLGLGGLAAAASWSPQRCLLTDGDEEAMDELRSTVERNQPTGPVMCTVRKVDWLEYSNTAVRVKERPDILIATDVTYNPKLVGPFIETAKAHLSRDNECTMLVVGQANRKSHWELYRCLRDGCNDIHGTRHLPWEGATRMLLYELVVEDWTVEVSTGDSTASIEGVELIVPIAVIVHACSPDTLDSLIGRHDHIATNDSWSQNT